MAERFARLQHFSVNDNPDEFGACIAAGALLLDSVSGKKIVQLKLALGASPCDNVKVKIHLYDTSGKIIGPEVVADYSCSGLPAGASFGEQVPIIVSPETVSFDAEIISTRHTTQTEANPGNRTKKQTTTNTLNNVGNKKVPSKTGTIIGTIAAVLVLAAAFFACYHFGLLEHISFKSKKPSDNDIPSKSEVFYLVDEYDCFTTDDIKKIENQIKKIPKHRKFAILVINDAVSSRYQDYYELSEAIAVQEKKPVWCIYFDEYGVDSQESGSLTNSDYGDFPFEWGLGRSMYSAMKTESFFSSGYYVNGILATLEHLRLASKKDPAFESGYEEFMNGLNEDYEDEDDFVQIVITTSEGVNIRKGPGKSNKVVGLAKYNNQYQVDVNEAVQADGYTWLKIGPDQWIAYDSEWIKVLN